MKKTFPSSDLGIDHLFPTEPEERKQKKGEQQRFAFALCIRALHSRFALRFDVSKLDHLVDGAQAKTTRYAVNVVKVIFAFYYYNKILKITFCLLKKMYNKIKRELYAANCECSENLSNFARPIGCPVLAVKCSKK